MRNFLRIAAMALLGLVSYEAQAQFYFKLGTGYSLTVLNKEELKNDEPLTPHEYDTKGGRVGLLGLGFEIPVGDDVTIPLGVSLRSASGKFIQENLSGRYYKNVSEFTRTTLSLDVLGKRRWTPEPTSFYTQAGLTFGTDVLSSGDLDNKETFNLNATFGLGVELGLRHSIGVDIFVPLLAVNTYKYFFSIPLMLTYTYRLAR